MLMKTFLKYLISIMLSFALAVAVVSLPSQSATAGMSSSDSDAIGGSINYLLPLLVMAQFYALQIVRMSRGGKTTGPVTLTMPLSDGSKVLIYIYRGKMIGYAHTH